MTEHATPCVLLFEASAGRALPLRDMLRERGLPTHAFNLNEPSTERAVGAADVAAIVLGPGDARGHEPQIQSLVTQLREKHVATLLWNSDPPLPVTAGGELETVDSRATCDEIVGRLSMLARYAPVLRRMDTEMEHLQRIATQLNRQFDEMDKDMRLAGRLQHEFLPRELDRIAPLRFAQLYRPAAWVSGDIYDVFCADEQRVGVFIADAMGHGTAAGLMTMFICRGLSVVRSRGKSRRPLRPSAALALLHQDLARLELPGAQFVTAAYAQIDTQTLEMKLARGGHPYPLHINTEGRIRELKCDGSLLGIPGITPAFSQKNVRLRGGDRLLFYTDGIERLFFTPRESDEEPAAFSPELRAWARLGARDFVEAVNAHLDHQEGSLNPEDDVTLLVVEVEKR